MSLEELDKLWIINSKGMCLLQQCFNGNQEKIEKAIFSGFVSAVIDFSDKIFDDRLEKISMGKYDLYCLPFQSGKFYVIISAKRGANEKEINQKIKEVGNAFSAEYGDCSDFQVFCEDDYSPFIDTVDKIFGTKTIRVIPEYEELIDLLDQAQKDRLPELETVERILAFFEQLPKNKKTVLLQLVLPTVTAFSESENLTYEQIKRFEKIFTLE